MDLIKKLKKKKKNKGKLRLKFYIFTMGGYLQR